MSQQPGYTSPNAPQQPNQYGQPDQYGQAGQYGQAPQQQYGQAPQHGQLPPPPPEEPKKSWFARHKILTGIGAVIALIVVINVFSGGGDDDAPSAAESSAATGDAGAESSDAAGPEDGDAEDGAAAEADDAAADDAEQEGEAPPEKDAADGFGIGDVAQDGKFEFVVTEVETGVEQVGSEYLNETAQGQFVLVHLEVTNVGDKAQTLFDSSQHLIDTDGREHSADSSAGIYIENNKVLLNEINPGNTLSGVLVFDIPADATPASVELHDSMFSGGVSISLE